VVFSYVPNAALRTGWKFEEEEEAVKILWDMRPIENDQLGGKNMSGRSGGTVACTLADGGVTKQFLSAFAIRGQLPS